MFVSKREIIELIETELKQKFSEYDVKPFPVNLSEYKFTQADGAILIVYSGGSNRGVKGRVQDEIFTIDFNIHFRNKELYEQLDELQRVRTEIEKLVLPLPTIGYGRGHYYNSERQVSNDSNKAIYDMRFEFAYKHLIADYERETEES